VLALRRLESGGRSNCVVGLWRLACARGRGVRGVLPINALDDPTAPSEAVTSPSRLSSHDIMNAEFRALAASGVRGRPVSPASPGRAVRLTSWAERRALDFLGGGSSMAVEIC
jgi:hypothetical protein